MRSEARRFRVTRSALAAFLADRRGATAVEYGVLCAMLAVLAAGAGIGLRDSVLGLYDRILTGMSAR